MILAGCLLDCVRPTFLISSGDRWSRDQLACHGFDHYSGMLWDAWSLLPHPAAILIDTRLTEGLDLWVATARNRGIPVISIHDLGLSPLQSDICIDGSINPVFAEADSRETAFFLGTQFMVLDPAYGSLHHEEKQIRERIRSIYINMGGGDSRKYYAGVLEGLRLWGRKAEVVGVPGFVNWGQERLAQMDWHPLDFRWEYDSVHSALSKADLAVTAGGLAAYEALSAGIPLLALPFDALQQRTVSSLAAGGMCVDLSQGRKMDPVCLSKAVSELDGDRQRRMEMSRLGRKTVDGLGAERVSEIIRKIVLAHTSGDAEESVK